MNIIFDCILSPLCIHYSAPDQPLISVSLRDCEVKQVTLKLNAFYLPRLFLARISFPAEPGLLQGP